MDSVVDFPERKTYGETAQDPSLYTAARDSHLLSFCLLHLMGLRGEGSAAKGLSVKRGRSTETRGA